MLERADERRVLSSITRRAALARGVALGAAAALMPLRRVRAFAADAPPPLLEDVPLERLSPRIEAEVDAAMAEFKVPGMSLALVREGRTVWHRNFGVQNKQTKQPVNDATVFEAASLTKPVVAYAALALVEQGKLDLDAPLATLLDEPYAEDTTGFLAQLTARHVLTHTTGLPNWLGSGKRARFLFRPGHRFSYSGEGFVYLQRVLDRITGAPLDAYLQRQLFEPLGMTSASLVWRDDYADRLAAGYGWPAEDRGIVMKQSEANAASSLVCTAVDYAKFVSHLFGAPVADGSAITLRDATTMWKPHIEAGPGVPWGTGIGVAHPHAGDACWPCGNNAARYNCFAVGFPGHRLGVVVMTNSGRGLKACARIVPAAVGTEHPALRWRKVVG